MADWFLRGLRRGDYQDATSSGGLANHGFIYSKGIYTAVDDPFAAINTHGGSTANGTTALGINDKGEVVGYYFDSNAHANGFLYSEGKYTALDDPLGIDGTVATGINDKGQVVGYYYDNLNNPHGFLYSGGKYTTLDDPAATAGTYVTGINNKSQVVGYYQGDSSNPHGFEANPEAVHNKDGSGMHGFPSLGEGQDNARPTMLPEQATTHAAAPAQEHLPTQLPPVAPATLGDTSQAPSVALLSQFMASTFVTAGGGQVETPIADPQSNQQPLLAQPHA